MTEPIGADTQATARETARIRASELRARQHTVDRRRRVILRSGLTAAIVGLIAVVAIVLVTFAHHPDGGPRNMISDGIVVGKHLEAHRTSALGVDETPIATDENGTGSIAIRMYVDYAQPVAATFEKANTAQLKAWLNSGAATLEIHPIVLTTGGPNGAQYSLHAANAAACVADLSPDTFFAYNNALLAHQPALNSQGLSDARLTSLARGVGVANPSRIGDCIRTLRFSKWVVASSSRATMGPLPHSTLKQVTVAPTILMDGKEFVYSNPADTGELAQFFVAANGGSFNSDPSPSPSASPSATPSASPSP